MLQPPSDTNDRAALRVVLASQSPRRRRLLEWLGLPFTSVAVDTPESLDTPLAADPCALAASLADEKATAARDEGLAEGALVLCFDTIVVLDDEVLGKPAGVEDAWRMLRALSGRTHQVVTGVALLTPSMKLPETFSVTTYVAMRPLSDADIEAWMAHGTFLGCAGAYNIEAQVAEVTCDECYQNVAGLPLCHLYAALAGRGSGIAAALPGHLAPPAAACDRTLGRGCRLGPRLIAGNTREHPSTSPEGQRADASRGPLSHTATMPDLGDIHSTAAGWYALKIANGEKPKTILGGSLDGVPYFEIELDSMTYWLTERGLFDPPPYSDAV